MSSNIADAEDSNHYDPELRLTLRLSTLDSETFDRVVEQIHTQHELLQSGNHDLIQKELDDARARLSPEDKVATSHMLLQEYSASSSESHIDLAVLLLKEAIQDTIDSDPRKVEYLTLLAGSLHSRLTDLAHAEDRDALISVMQKLLGLTPDTEEAKVLHYCNLGNFFIDRFSNLKNDDDLMSALETYRRGVAIATGAHIHRGAALTSLARGLMARSIHYHDPDDHQMAIIHLQEAAELPFSAPEQQAIALRRLSQALEARYESHQSIDDLSYAIDILQKAVDLIPDRDSDRARVLKHLAAVLQKRFSSTNSISDLDAIVTILRRCTEFQRSADYVETLRVLGTTLWQRFDVTGNRQDIDQAIGTLKQVSNLAPDDPSTLSTLGVSLLIRFERLGTSDDLQEAVSTQQRAADLLSEDESSLRAGVLVNLGNALQMRFECEGKLNDIDAAIIGVRTAVDLLPDDNPEKLMALHTLGTAYHRRYDFLRETSDMSASLSSKLAASRIMPPGHPQEALLLNGLGAAWLLSYEVDADRDALENAISALTRSADLTPDIYSHKSVRLHNLSRALYERSKLDQSEADISDAISIQERAVASLPDDSPWRRAAALNSLASCLMQRFEDFGSKADIDDSISIMQHCVEVVPPGHLDAASFITNLGKAYARRFKLTQSSTDIDSAIKILGTAVKVPSRPGVLHFTSTVGWARLCAEHRDPSEAIAAYRVVLEQIPKLIWHGSKVHRRLEDIKQIRSVIPEAVSVAVCAEDFTAAVEWAESGRCIIWGQMLEVLSAPIDALRRVAPDLAEDLQTVSRELAQSWHSSSLRVSKYHSPVSAHRPRQVPNRISPMTLTMLRALLKVTSPELRGTGEILAQPSVGAPNFEDKLIAFMLGVSGNTVGEFTMEAPSDHDLLTLKRAYDAIEGEQRRLAVRYEELIRMAQATLPGFKDLLQPKETAELRRAARDGPVVLINVHDSCCDAFALLSHSDNVIHIPLPRFSEDTGQKLLSSLFDVLRQRGRKRASISSRAIRLISVGGRPAATLQTILKRLWLLVVQPILDALDGKLLKPEGNKLPRITWCANGPLAFLPLHAAGIYDRDGPDRAKTFDRVVSSYTPSLTALSKAQKLQHISTPRAFAVSQPNTPDAGPLPCTVEEVRVVQEYLPNVTWLDGASATKKKVLDAMKDHEWVHLACHALQDSETPAKSGFMLQDDYLEVLDIMREPLPHARLAVLSACETATGDTNYPEEAIHLAAGMLAAGYKSVIATMWSIDDEDAPVLARHLYDYLMNQAGGDGDQAAYALHYATEKLRERVGETDLARWLPFVHFGA